MSFDPKPVPDYYQGVDTDAPTAPAYSVDWEGAAEEHAEMHGLEATVGEWTDEG